VDVRKTSRTTSYLLVFILGVLSLRTLLPGIFDSAQGQCQEFGHIHFYKPSTPVHHSHSTNEFNPSRSNEEDGCHEGKSVLSYSSFPPTPLNLAVPKYELVFELVYSVENSFLSPDLEPRRRPPKGSAEIPRLFLS
jgi:hypothetical protein